MHRHRRKVGMRTKSLKPERTLVFSRTGRQVVCRRTRPHARAGTAGGRRGLADSDCTYATLNWQLSVGTFAHRIRTRETGVCDRDRSLEGSDGDRVLIIREPESVIANRAWLCSSSPADYIVTSCRAKYRR